MRTEKEIRDLFEKALQREEDVAAGAWAVEGQSDLIRNVRSVLGWVLGEKFYEPPDLGITSHDDGE